MYADWSIAIGSTRTFAARLEDAEGVLTDITGATEAKFSICDQLGGTEFLPAKAATIDIPTSVVECEILGEESALLAPGMYVFDIAILINGNWYNTEPQYVYVTERVTTTG